MPMFSFGFLLTLSMMCFKALTHLLAHCEKNLKQTKLQRL